MRLLLTVSLALGLVSAACAGGNPNVRTYIDFDPPNYVHEFTTELYTSFEAYVCMDQVDSGVTAVSFRVTNLVQEYPWVVATQSWYQLFPGDLPLYWPWLGSTIVSTECMTEDEGPVLVGYLSYFCVGDGPACLEILDHSDYPRWVVDCADPCEVDFYCVLANASINGGVCPEGDCSPVPVENGSWGSIKSMYR